MSIVAEHIHTISMFLRGNDGTKYQVHVYGAQRADGTWEGWLEFHPFDNELPVLRTGQETSQPNRLTLDYWAGGLELIYLQGALHRAIELADTTRTAVPTPDRPARPAERETPPAR